MIARIDRIAEEANEAARRWVEKPSEPKPRNPFDSEWAPDAHAHWAERFNLALLRVSAGVEA